MIDVSHTLFEDNDRRELQLQHFEDELNRCEDCVTPEVQDLAEHLLTIRAWIRNFDRSAAAGQHIVAVSSLLTLQDDCRFAHDQLVLHLHLHLADVPISCQEWHAFSKLFTTRSICILNTHVANACAHFSFVACHVMPWLPVPRPSCLTSPQSVHATCVRECMRAGGRAQARARACVRACVHVLQPLSMLGRCPPIVFSFSNRPETVQQDFTFCGVSMVLITLLLVQAQSLLEHAQARAHCAPEAHWCTRTCVCVRLLCSRCTSLAVYSWPTVPQPCCCTRRHRIKRWRTSCSPKRIRMPFFSRAFKVAELSC